MNFMYLNLPPVPENYIQLCLNNIPLSWTNKKLIELNKKEGISHSITYLPIVVRLWLIKNVISLIDPKNEHDELQNKMMLHVNKYIDIKDKEGTHPIHVDYGRKYAFNYILTSGSNDLPITSWYKDDKKTVIEEHKIETKKWHMIAVNPVFHGVRGQEKGMLRTIISLCYDYDETQNETIWKKFDYLKI